MSWHHPCLEFSSCFCGSVFETRRKVYTCTPEHCAAPFQYQNQRNPDLGGAVFCDAALVQAYIEVQVQCLIFTLPLACKAFGLWSVDIMAQNAEVFSSSHHCQLHSRDNRQIHLSWIDDYSRSDAEVNIRIAKSAAVLATFNKRVWNND